MEQLLSIKRIPIDIEINVQRAELKAIESQIHSGSRSVNIMRHVSDGRIQADPVSFDLDTKRFDSFVESNSDNSFTLNYQGYAKLGNSDASVKNTNNPVKINKASRSLESILNSLPKSKSSSNVSFDNGKLSIDYFMDDSDSFDFNEPGFEFIPGKIEFIINQMPGLEIEYLGKPLYFPMSADPDYVPAVDIFA